MPHYLTKERVDTKKKEKSLSIFHLVARKTSEHPILNVRYLSWPRQSQRSGEIDAVEGVALAIRKVGVKAAS